MNKFFVIALSSLCFGLFGCSMMEPESDAIIIEETYRVGTACIAYSDYQTTFEESLDDGYYWAFESTSSSQINVDKIDSENTLYNMGFRNLEKHDWTKDKIKDWMQGRGFSYSKAIEMSSWMTTIKSGFIFVRNNSIVYLIVK